jgi:hypothetical protein
MITDLCSALKNLLDSSTSLNFHLAKNEENFILSAMLNFSGIFIFPYSLQNIRHFKTKKKEYLCHPVSETTLFLDQEPSDSLGFYFSRLKTKLHFKSVLLPQVPHEFVLSVYDSNGSIDVHGKTIFLLKFWTN